MESILLLLALSTCVEQPSQCSTSSTANNETMISACGLLPKGKGTNGTGANGGDPSVLAEGSDIELRGRVNGEDYIVILSEQCEVI